MKKQKEKVQTYNFVNETDRYSFSLPNQQFMEEQDQTSFNPFYGINIQPCNQKISSDSMIEVKQPTIFSSGTEQKIETIIISSPVEESFVQDQENDLLDQDVDISIESVEEDILEIDKIKLQPENITKAINIQFVIGQQKSNQIGDFFKVLLAKRMVQVFKKNLMQNANVQSKIQNHELKSLLEEDYLKKQSKKQQKKRIALHKKLHPLVEQKETQNLLKRTLTKINIIVIKTVKIKNKLKIPVFEPGNKILVVWEFFKIIFILLIFWWGPFEVSFGILQSDQNNLIENFMMAFFTLDIIIKLNKGFINQGDFVKCRKSILTNYLKKEAYADIISLLCLGVLFYIKNQSLFLVFIFIFFNTSKITRGFRKIQESSYFQGNSIDMLDLVKLVLVIFFFAHVIACIWHYVGAHGLNSGTSWIIVRGIQNDSPWTLYNQSFYWATMTMVTVGYGDITPTNDYEMVVANVTMFVACGVFAFSVNSIGIVLQNINEGRMKFKRTLNLINNYMNRNDVSFELQSRVRNYLEYCYEQESELFDEQTTQLVSKLSTSLRQELLFHILGKVLNNCKVISSNFSHETQNRISCLMEAISFCPEEKIITQDLLDDGSMFIIQKGEVILFEERTQKKIKVLRKGDSFGEVGFFTGCQRTCSISSLGFCRLYKIKREMILDVIKDNKKELEMFHMIKDKMLYKHNYDCAYLKCYTCEKSNHLVMNCPSIRYLPDLERIIKKELYHNIQERDRKFRRKPRSANIQKCRTNMKQFQETGYLFMKKKARTQSEEDSEQSKEGEYTYQGMLSQLDSNFIAQFEPALDPTTKLDDIHISKDESCSAYNDNEDNVPSIMVDSFAAKKDAKTNFINVDSIRFNGPLMRPQKKGVNKILLGDDIQHQSLIKSNKLIRHQEERQISLLVPGDAFQNVSQVSVSQDGYQPKIKSLIFDSQKIQQESQRKSQGLVQMIDVQSSRRKSKALVGFPNVQSLGNSQGRHTQSNHEDRSVQFAHDLKGSHDTKVTDHEATFARQFSKGSTHLSLNNKQITSKKKTFTTENQDRDSDQEEETHSFLDDMDSMVAYQHYYPLHNVDAVCKLHSRVQRNRQRYINSQKEEKKMSKYTFYNEVIKRVMRLKHYLRALEKGIEPTTKSKKTYVYPMSHTHIQNMSHIQAMSHLNIERQQPSSSYGVFESRLGKNN